jgi:predicted GNAT family N-acyltransferase
MTSPDGYGRALAFMRELDRRASSRLETLPFGTAFLRPELPHVWSRNFVWVTSGADQLDLDRMIETVERVHVEAGLDHRRAAFADEAAAGAAAVPLQPQGWQPGRIVVMSHPGPRAVPPVPPGAREVGRPALRPMKREIMQLDPQTSPEEVTRQLLDAYDVLGEVARERSFGYDVDGEVVASCRLYSDGATAQIEDVGTLPARRGRGYANAVVGLALEEAWKAHDFVFIEAEAADWPKDWYARIGFETIGAVCDLVRHPQPHEYP